MALECEFEFPFECVWLRAFEQTKTQFESLATNLQGICNISHCYRYLAVAPGNSGLTLGNPGRHPQYVIYYAAVFFFFFCIDPKSAYTSNG